MPRGHIHRERWSCWDWNTGYHGAFDPGTPGECPISAPTSVSLGSVTSCCQQTLLSERQEGELSAIVNSPVCLAWDIKVKC